MSRFPRKKSRRSGVPLGQYIGRRRVRSWVTICLAVGVLLLLSVADYRGWLLYGGGDWERYEGRFFLVTRVVDGDTLDIDIADRDRPTTRVRLWGIDTPELARLDRGRPAEPFAQESAERARRLSEGQRVRLHLEPHSMRGRFGRLLAYVELPDGSMLNERLLVDGLARADDRFSHRWVERYSLLELQAKRDDVGLWGE